MKKIPRKKYKSTVYIPDKNGDLFSMRQLSKKLERSISWVRRCYKMLGCDTVEKLEYCKKNPPEGTKLTELSPSVLDFDRSKTCHRKNGRAQCDHYRTCSDARCIGKHHERFKVNGSCFVCAKIKEFGPVPE